MSADSDAAKRAQAAAVTAFLALDQVEVEMRTCELIEALDGSVDWETTGWLLDGLRMRMFFACERCDGGAVEEEAASIEKLSRDPGAGKWLSKYAINWARGWSNEIRGEFDMALRNREAACSMGAERAYELQGHKQWLPGEGSEARLLVDLFADLLRSARVCTSPAKALARIHLRFGDPLGRNTYIELARHQRMGQWTQRRALLRVVYEVADRQHGSDPDMLRERKRILDRIERLDEHHQCALVRLEQPMIEMEKLFASNSIGARATDIQALRDEAEAHAMQHGLRRRKEALSLLWPRISKHGILV